MSLKAYKNIPTEFAVGNFYVVCNYQIIISVASAESAAAKATTINGLSKNAIITATTVPTIALVRLPVE